MNLTELIKATRRHLSESGTGLFTDADVTNALNSSAKTLAAECGFLRRRTSITTTGSTLTLPADLHSVLGVWEDNRRRELRPISPADLPRPGEYGYTGGLTECYAFDPQYGQTLTLSPAGTGGTFTVDYLSTGTPMTAGTDTPWFNQFDNYHDVIAWHAAHTLSGFKGLTGAGQMAYLQRHEQRMAEFRGAVSMQQVSGQPLSYFGVAHTIRRPRRGGWRW